MNDILGLLDRALDCKAVLVDAVQVASHLEQLLVALDVREVNLCKAARLEVGKRLLSTRVESLYVRIRVLHLEGTPHAT